jgi:hypothetical protein
MGGRMKTRVCAVAAALVAVTYLVCYPMLADWREAGAAYAQGRPPVPPPAVTLSEDTPSLEEVLDRYVEAIGGSEAVERLETRVIRGRVVTDLPTWDPPVHEVDSLAVYSKVPGRYLTVQQTSKGTVLEGCDGENSWKRDVDGRAFAFHPVDAGSAWIIDPRFPIRLREYFPDMVLLGTAMLDGRQAHVVDIDDSHLHRLYFDAESHLLLRIGYNTKLMDCRVIDGVMVPFEVEYSRKGGSSTFVVNSVVHNEPIDDGLFAQPVTP